jgi:hypothetical protein
MKVTVLLHKYNYAAPNLLPPLMAAGLQAWAMGTPGTFWRLGWAPWRLPTCVIRIAQNNGHKPG